MRAAWGWRFWAESDYDVVVGAGEYSSGYAVSEGSGEEGALRGRELG